MNQFIKKTHKMLGLVLSIFLFMWCFSGFVMIYRSFPRITQEQKNKLLTPLDLHSLPDINMLSAYVDTTQYIQQMNLFRISSSESVFKLESKGKRSFIYVNDSIVSQTLVPFEKLYTIASRLTDADIVRIDTLHSADMWVIGTKIDDYFPMYKFYYADKDRTELYLSAQSGEAMQYTDKYARFWSYLGAIPHWLYVPKMREKSGASWRLTGQIISGLSATMVLFGMWVALSVFISYTRRRKVIRSPYKKRWYRWHYLYGSIFGIVLFLFLFSGFLSFTKVPLWIVKEHRSRAVLSDFCQNKLIFNTQTPDYKDLISAFSSTEIIKELKWIPFGKQLFCQVKTDNGDFLVDMYHPSKRIDELDSIQLLTAVRSIQPEKKIKDFRRLDAYDHRYIARKGDLPLPVYRVSIDDPDNSTYYIDPKTLYFKYFNNNLTLSRHLYHGIHRLEFPWSIKHPLIRELTELFLLVVCLFLSTTGVVLSVKYLKRSFRKRKTKASKKL